MGRIASLIGPDIDIDAIAPVIDGNEDGIMVVGIFEGVVDGRTLGLAVMKTSQINTALW